MPALWQNHQVRMRDQRAKLEEMCGHEIFVTVAANDQGGTLDFSYRFNRHKHRAEIQFTNAINKFVPSRRIGRGGSPVIDKFAVFPVELFRRKIAGKGHSFWRQTRDAKPATDNNCLCNQIGMPGDEMQRGDRAVTEADDHRFLFGGGLKNRGGILSEQFVGERF